MPRRRPQIFISILALFLFVTAATAQTQTNAPAASASPVATKSEPAPATQNAAAPASAAPADSPAASDTQRLSFMTDERDQTTAAAPSSLGLLARTIGALLLIVGLIVGVGWGLRRFGKGRFGIQQGADAPQLAVLSTTGLGDRRSLSVVRFGERILLIGSTAQAMTLLATEDLPGEADTSAIRSVADLLNDDEARGFEDELLIADKRFQPERPEWNEDESAGEV